MDNLYSFVRRRIALLVLVFAMLMQASFVFAQSNALLCFTARNDSVTVRFDIRNITHTIQYSTDGTTWNNYTPNSNVAIAADQSVYFRAATNQTTATAFGNNAGSLCSRFYFSSVNGGTVEASGNIMSLYGPDCPDLPLPFVAFSKLFYQCILLTKAPALPATVLQTYCYLEMFTDCSSLTVPPSLPATTLKDFCYAKMFKGCTSMVIDTVGPGVPWIIHDTIGSASYPLLDMFYGTSGTMNGTPHANTTYYIASAPKYSVTVNVNDSTMGNVTGAGMYYIGDTATLTATPNAGYEFDCWSNGEKSQTISIVVVSDTVMSASFKIQTGVEDLQNNEFVVYSEKSNIVVSGAMNKKVSLYDVNGRLVAETPNANETHEFAVAMTGIYMVCIDNRNTLKVIVK